MFNSLTLRNRIAKLKRKIRQLKAEVRYLQNYTHGYDGRQLGTKPSTPCILGDYDAVAEAKRKFLATMPKPKLVLCHWCDERRCVLLEHYFWGTMSDNLRDCMLKGRHLTFAQVTQESLERRVDVACAMLFKLTLELHVLTR